MSVRLCRPKLFKNLCLSLVSDVPHFFFSGLHRWIAPTLIRHLACVCVRVCQQGIASDTHRLTCSWTACSAAASHARLTHCSGLSVGLCRVVAVALVSAELSWVPMILQYCVRSRNRPPATDEKTRKVSPIPPQTPPGGLQRSPRPSNWI